MSERQKLPRYIVVLNIIMIAILLAICGLIFALALNSKDLGWSVPSADDSAGSSISEPVSQSEPESSTTSE